MCVYSLYNDLIDPLLTITDTAKLYISVNEDVQTQHLYSLPLFLGVNYDLWFRDLVNFSMCKCLRFCVDIEEIRKLCSIPGSLYWRHIIYIQFQCSVPGRMFGLDRCHLIFIWSVLTSWRRPAFNIMLFFKRSSSLPLVWKGYTANLVLRCNRRGLHSTAHQV